MYVSTTPAFKYILNISEANRHPTGVQVLYFWVTIYETVCHQGEISQKLVHEARVTSEFEKLSFLSDHIIIYMQLLNFLNDNVKRVSYTSFWFISH